MNMTRLLYLGDKWNKRLTRLLNIVNLAFLVESKYVQGCSLAQQSSLEPIYTIIKELFRSGQKQDMKNNVYYYNYEEFYDNCP